MAAAVTYDSPVQAQINALYNSGGVETISKDSIDDVRKHFQAGIDAAKKIEAKYGQCTLLIGGSVIPLALRYGLFYRNDALKTVCFVATVALFGIGAWKLYVAHKAYIAIIETAEGAPSKSAGVHEAAQRGANGLVGFWRPLGTGYGFSSLIDWAAYTDKEQTDGEYYTGIAYQVLCQLAREFGSKKEIRDQLLHAMIFAENLEQVETLRRIAGGTFESSEYVELIPDVLKGDNTASLKAFCANVGITLPDVDGADCWLRANLSNLSNEDVIKFKAQLT